MDSSESTSPEPNPKRGLHRGVLTAAASVAMVLAGLGVAGAQTDGTAVPTVTKAEKPAATTEGNVEPTKEPGCHDGHHRHPGRKAKLDTAAEAIGISREDLVTALRDGQSIAQVARSEDVDPQKVIDALVAEAKERLAERVEGGHLTQAQADQKVAMLTERVTELVNREGLPMHRHGRRGPRPANA
jgi:hypothetical protein